MSQSSDNDVTLGCRYALCVGIGTYTNLANRNLRYAIDDAAAIADQLEQKGDFIVTRLTTPSQTTKAALDQAVEHLLSAPGRQDKDLILLYFSCHGYIEPVEDTFCLVPSDATLQANGMLNPTTLIDISGLTNWFSQAKTYNIVLFLDVCHSGGAAVALQRFELPLKAGPNYFILGAARQDQPAMQSSELGHGLFTNCLLRAFGQPPTKDGWLTISQIQNFVSDEIQYLAKDRPISIQGSSVFDNPLLSLLRNPDYPELYPLPPFWNVPQRNDFFTGQEEILSQLASMLHSEQKTVLMQPYAISGLGGIGKTQLVLEYAYRHRQDYHAILWGNADKRGVLISSFTDIAHLLDLPQKDKNDQMAIVEAVKTWLARHSQWLLILDNVEDLALVKEFLPPAFQGHVLLTTRSQILGTLAHNLEVDVMRPEIGASLLLRRSKLLAPKMALEQASPIEIKLAQELAQELGGLPLALDQAAAYIDETRCGLEQYLQRYRERRANLLQRRGELVDHPDSVVTTLSLSLEKAAEKAAQLSLVVVNVMRLCAYVSPDAIPEELFTIRSDGPELVLAPLAADDFELDEAIAALRAYSLVSRDWDTHTLTVHRLVQAVVGDSLSVEMRQQWKRRAVLAMSGTYPDARDIEQWDACERWLPHTLVCAKWIEQEHINNRESANLLNYAGYYLDVRARYTEAEPLYQRALSIREQLLGSNHPDTAYSLNNLAALYWTQGKYEQAEPLYLRAFSIQERLGATSLDTAIGLNNLAALYKNQGRYAEAEPLYQRALAIREQWLGATHPDVAQSLNNLAALYNAQGRYEQAEPLYQRALSIYEQQLGATHPATTQSLNNLLALYNAQNKYEQAESLIQHTLHFWEQQLPRDAQRGY